MLPVGRRRPETAARLGDADAPSAIFDRGGAPTVHAFCAFKSKNWPCFQQEID